MYNILHIACGVVGSNLCKFGFSTTQIPSLNLEIKEIVKISKRTAK